MCSAVSGIRARPYCVEDFIVLCIQRNSLNMPAFTRTHRGKRKQKQEWVKKVAVDKEQKLKLYSQLYDTQVVEEWKKTENSCFLVARLNYAHISHRPLSLCTEFIHPQRNSFANRIEVVTAAPLRTFHMREISISLMLKHTQCRWLPVDGIALSDITIYSAGCSACSWWM